MVLYQGHFTFLIIADQKNQELFGDVPPWGTIGKPLLGIVKISDTNEIREFVFI